MEQKQIYELVRSIEPADAALMAVQAHSEEERKFWLYVHDMNYRQQLQEAATRRANTGV